MSEPLTPCPECGRHYGHLRGCSRDPAEAVRDDEPVRLREAIDAVIGEKHLRFQVTDGPDSWEDGFNRGLDALRDALAALPDEPVRLPTYEDRVKAMADALHEDCRLEWQAIAVADPERMVTQHMADAHYGKAHARLADVSGTTTTDADTGGEE